MSSNEAPERKCILTGAHGDRANLIRLALSEDGAVLPDLGAKAPGRGAWVAPDRAVLETAVARGKLRGALMRAFKGASLSVPDDLAERIETGLARRALERLGLEMRAGNLILGSDRIGEAVRAFRVRLLLHVADAAANGRAKLDRTGIKVLILPASAAELSLALGRENVIHAALCDQGAADRVAAAVGRWRAFCGSIDETGAGSKPAFEDDRI